MRAPRLVDDEGDAAGVCDLRQGADVGDGPEVRRGDHPCPHGVRRALQRLIQGLGREAVCDAQLGVDLRFDERGPQPREDQRVDGARVSVALDDDVGAAVRQRETRREVPLRGAVDQEPRAPGPPGLRRELLGLFEGRRVRPHVDPVCERRDVHPQRLLADGFDEPWVGALATLVPRHVEPGRPTARILRERVDVRSPVLVLHGYASSPSRPCARSHASLRRMPSSRETRGS